MMMMRMFALERSHKYVNMLLLQIAPCCLLALKVGETQATYKMGSTNLFQTTPNILNVNMP